MMNVRTGKLLRRMPVLLPATLMMLWATTVAAQTGSGADLTGSAWRAEAIRGRDVVDGARSTLEFAEPGRVAGNAGCNRYFGPVSMQGDAMAFGNLAATRMMCPPEPMDQEERFMQALQEARRFELDDDAQTLLVYGEGPEPLLRFHRVVEK